MRCKHITKENVQCKAYSLMDREFCFTHDPSVADIRKIAVQKGGLSHKNKPSEKPLKRLPAKKPSQMLTILEDTINRVRTNPMTPQQAKCIESLISLALKIQELSEYEN